MDKSEIQNRIKLSNLKDEGKAKLLEAVASLGKGGLKILGQGLVLSNTDQYEAAVRFKFVMALAQATTDLENGNSNALNELLVSSLGDPELEFGKVILPAVNDIRSASLKSSEVLDALHKFELQMFRYLPKEELETIIASDLIYFSRKFDIVGAFRKAYLIAEPEYDGGLWAQGWSDVLKNNQEDLGQQQLNIDGKQVKSAVKNWVQDYEIFTKKPAEERSAYDQVHYIDTAPNVRGLSKDDRNVLLSLLRLYEWFLDPYVAFEDAKELGFGPLIESGTSVSSTVTKSVQATPIGTPVVPKPPEFKIPSAPVAVKAPVPPVQQKPVSRPEPSRLMNVSVDLPVQPKESQPVQVKPSAMPPLVKPKPKDVNIQEMLKSDKVVDIDAPRPGIKPVDMPIVNQSQVRPKKIDTSFEKIKQHMEAKPVPPAPAPAMDIEKKLAALRQKTENQK